MNILENVESIDLDYNKNKLFGIKSAIVWGHDKNANITFPLFYIKKPKNISDQDFTTILENLEISIRPIHKDQQTCPLCMGLGKINKYLIIPGDF